MTQFHVFRMHIATSASVIQTRRGNRDTDVKKTKKKKQMSNNQSDFQKKNRIDGCMQAWEREKEENN